MSHFQQHQEFYDKTIHLSEEEEKDPISVIDMFFTDYKLSEIRQLNRDMDDICLSTDKAPFEDADRRDFLLAYRWSEVRVLEAAWILLHNRASDTKPSKTDDPNWNRKVNIAKLLNLDNLQKKVSEIELRMIKLLATLVNASNDLMRFDCKKIEESLRNLKIYPPNGCLSSKEPSTKDQEPFAILDLHDLSNQALELQSKVAELSGIVTQAWSERIKLLNPEKPVFNP